MPGTPFVVGLPSEIDCSFRSISGYQATVYHSRGILVTAGNLAQSLSGALLSVKENPIVRREEIDRGNEISFQGSWVHHSISLVAAVGFTAYLFFTFPRVGPPAEVGIEPTPERIARAIPSSPCDGLHRLPFNTGLERLRGAHRPGDGRKRRRALWGGTGTSRHPVRREHHASRHRGLDRRRNAPGHDQRRDPGWASAIFADALPRLQQDVSRDAYSIIAYIRTLKPIENIVPESRVHFP